MDKKCNIEETDSILKKQSLLPATTTRMKGRKARDTFWCGSANKERKMYSHEMQEETEKEAKSVWGVGGARKKQGEGENGSAEVIYGSCIIFYNAAPALWCLALPPPYPTLPLGCAPPHCHG